MPINRIDEVCMHHDIAYRDADEGRGTRCEADRIMLNELNELDDNELTCNELLAKCFVSCAIGLLYCLRKLCCAK